MRKIYLLLGLLILAMGCEKEEMNQFSDDEKASSLEEIPIEDLPSSVTAHFDYQRSFGQDNQKSAAGFGAVYADMPASKITSESGEISYTLVLESSGEATGKSLSRSYFDNLVILEKGKNTSVYIIRYEPTEEWKAGSRDFESFSGSITFYTSGAEKISSMKVTEGEMIKRSQNGDYKTVCYLKLESIINVCTPVYHEGSWSYECGTTYHYVRECSPGGGGDDSSGSPEPESIPSVPTEPDFDWDYGGGSGTTSPVLPQPEEVKIQNNLTDPCAKDIFEHLRTGPLVDHPLKPEVQIPEEEIYNLSTDILDLFNNHRTVDYSIGNDNSGNRTYASYGQVYTFLDISYLGTATSLSIARTLIHEGLHAYLLLENSNPQSSLFGSLNEYAKANGYSDANDIHHNFMGSYIDAMAYSLYKWDTTYGTGGLKDSSGKIDAEYYRAMAFGGFYNFDRYGNRIDYDSFKALIPNKGDRDSIVEIIKNEQDGNSDSRGEGC